MSNKFFCCFFIFSLQNCFKTLQIFSFLFSVCMYICQSVYLLICLSVSRTFYRCLAARCAASSVCILIDLSVYLSVGFCTLLCPIPCICSHHQSCMVVCLQSLGTKGILHPLPTLQNNEPVPQVLKQVVNLSCLT